MYRLFLLALGILIGTNSPGAVSLVSAQETSSPIRIGATVSSSGKYSESAAMMRDGYRLWVKQVNQRGGLLNRPVELVLYDDKSNAQLAHDLYVKLMDEDKVDLLLSPYGTPLMLEITKATEPRRMVVLASAASGSSIWNRKHKYVFGMYALANRYFIGMLDLMARNGFKSVSIVYEHSPFNLDVANGVNNWAKRFGLTVKYDKAYPPGQLQPGAVLQEIAQNNADGLIVSAYTPDGYSFLGELSKASWRPKALGMPILPIHPDFYRKAGPIAEGVFSPSQWEPDERIPFPGTRRFIKAFKTTYNKLPSYHAGSAYASCQILEQAVSHTRTIDHELIRNYIQSLDTVTVIGRFKVDHTGKQVGHNSILIQWQDGKKEIVYPTKMRTAPPKF